MLINLVRAHNEFVTIITCIGHVTYDKITWNKNAYGALHNIKDYQVPKAQQMQILLAIYIVLETIKQEHNENKSTHDDAHRPMSVLRLTPQV